MVKYLFSIASLLTACSLLAQNQVNLSINPATAEVGETFEITVSSTELGTIDFGEMPDAFVQDYAIQKGSSQHQGSNGKSVIQHYYTISGVIKKAGDYTFGPVTLTHGNRTFPSNKATISISPKLKMKGGAISSRQLRDPAFGTIEVNKTELYEGEPLLVRAKIYARYKPSHIDNYLAYEMDGALIKHPLGQNNRLKTLVEQFHGENLYAIDYDKNIIFPTAVGNVVIEPYKLDLHQGYQNFPLESSSLTVYIRPLPANPPNDFIGAVGAFSVSRELPETAFEQGAVIKMMVHVTGIGNLHNITPPQLNLPKGFTVYGDPVIVEELNFGVRGSQGKVSYEYNIEVNTSGEMSLPPTSITYFDPNLERYVTTETDKDSLSIESNGSNLASSNEGNNGNRTNELIVQESRPRANTGSEVPGTFYGSGLFWSGVSLPFATAFLFLLFVKSRDQKEERKEEKKRKQVQSALLSSQMQTTKLALASEDSKEFYTALVKTLRSAYAAHMSKLDESPSKDEILKYSETFSSELKHKTESLFSSAEIAKFSFGSDTDKRQEDFQALDTILQTLKSIK